MHCPLAVACSHIYISVRLFSLTPSITMRLEMVILQEGFGSEHPYQLILMHLKSLELLVSVSFIFKFFY